MLGHCAVPNCSGGRSDSQPLFRFPLDAERCKEWTEKCQREDLTDKPAEQLYKFERVCGKHFEPSAIDRESQAGVVLKDEAVPTIFDDSDGTQASLGKRKEAGKSNEKEAKGRKKMKKPEAEPARGDNETVTDEGENLEFLKSLFEIVLFLGGHNILPPDQRGDSQDRLGGSNFHALVEYRILSGDKTVQKKWEEFKQKSQDELGNIIDACEQSIRSKLVEEVLKNGSFSLLTDELVMISGALHLPVLVRFVDASNRQQERFLGFVPFDGDEDGALSEIVEKWGLNLEQCKGQAHSCSGTHSGRVKKFAAKVTERFPAAALTVRSIQTVNLAVAGNMSLPGVQLVVATLKKIEAFFQRSPLLHDEFEHAISLLYADREEKATALKEISKTKWTSSHNVFEVTVEIYESLLLWLDSVNDNEDVRWSDQVAQEAMVISKALTDFEFVMTLIVLKNITALTNAFGKNMLGDAADVGFAANSLPAVLVLVKEVVENIDVYHEFWYEEAVTVAAAVDVVVRVPRSFVRKLSETVVVQPDSYFKEHVSLAVVHGIHTELSEAFGDSVLNTLKGFSLVPAAIEQKKSVKPDEDCAQFFKDDVPNAGALSAEFNCWWVKWCKKNKQERFVANVRDVLQLADMKFFPNMMAVFRRIAIVPCVPLDASCNVVYECFKKYMENVPDKLKSRSIAFMNINSDVQCELESMVQLYLKKQPE